MTNRTSEIEYTFLSAIGEPYTDYLFYKDMTRLPRRDWDKNVRAGDFGFPDMSELLITTTRQVETTLQDGAVNQGLFTQLETQKTNHILQLEARANQSSPFPVTMPRPDFFVPDADFATGYSPTTRHMPRKTTFMQFDTKMPSDAPDERLVIPCGKSLIVTNVSAFRAGVRALCEAYPDRVFEV